MRSCETKGKTNWVRWRTSGSQIKVLCGEDTLPAKKWDAFKEYFQSVGAMSELPSIHSRSMVSWGLAGVLRSRIAALLHRAADHLAGLSSLASLRLHPSPLCQSPTIFTLVAVCQVECMSRAHSTVQAFLVTYLAPQKLRRFSWLLSMTLANHILGRVASEMTHLTSRVTLFLTFWEIAPLRANSFLMQQLGIQPL